MSQDQQRRGDPVEDAVDHGANVLVLSPSLADRTASGCSDLLEAAGPVEAAVFVSLARDPGDRLRRWSEQLEGGPPERVGVVAVGGRTGEEGQERIPVPGGPAPARVERLGNAFDPTDVWVAIGEFLDRWDDARAVLCFDSLTVLLQYADTERTFRFCHALTGRVRSGGHAAHYHLDPETVEPRTVRTLAQVFDTVVELEEGEAVTHRWRE